LPVAWRLLPICPTRDESCQNHAGAQAFKRAQRRNQLLELFRTETVHQRPDRFQAGKKSESKTDQPRRSRRRMPGVTRLRQTPSWRPQNSASSRHPLPHPQKDATRFRRRKERRTGAFLFVDQDLISNWRADLGIQQGARPSLRLTFAAIVQDSIIH
jgi:hypothetical protein